MFELLFVSLVWAFSFGIIKGQLTGIDSHFISCARLFISLLVFLPFLRLKGIDRKLAFKLIGIGAVQYGLMYITYTYSFQYLKAYQVALFTIFTPLYVTIIYNVIKRHFFKLYLATTLLAIIGAAIVVQTSLLQSEMLLGFIILQLSNLSFAFGQVLYKEEMSRTSGLKDQNIFALLYLGGFLLTLISSLAFTNWATVQIGRNQLLALLYLGMIASGLCFFLWNAGARKVNTGTLAVFNNLKIPLGILVSLTIFGEKADLPHLMVGGLIIVTALAINEWGTRLNSRPLRQAAAEGD